jgi:hypothetical protein
VCVLVIQDAGGDSPGGFYFEDTLTVHGSARAAELNGDGATDRCLHMKKRLVLLRRRHLRQGRASAMAVLAKFHFGLSSRSDLEGPHAKRLL